MSIVKTEAFVLKSIKYNESSKIVTLFTKEFGKMNAIVKGARNYKSKMCGTLETMNYINAVIYLKENRELQLISNAEYKKSFKNILADFDKLQAAFRIIEILNKSLIDREINNSIFELLINLYEKLNNSINNTNAYVLYFQIELVKILGLNPNFSNLDRNSETFFEYNELNVSKCDYEILKMITENEIEDLDIDEGMMINLTNNYEKYILSHTQGYTSYKTTKIFKELNQTI